MALLGVISPIYFWPLYKQSIWSITHIKPFRASMNILPDFLKAIDKFPIWTYTHTITYNTGIVKDIEWHTSVDQSFLYTTPYLVIPGQLPTLGRVYVYFVSVSFAFSLLCALPSWASVAFPVTLSSEGIRGQVQPANKDLINQTRLEAMQANPGQCWGLEEERRMR